MALQRWTKNLEVYIWVNGISDGRKSTGIEYTRTVSVHNSHPSAAFDLKVSCPMLKELSSYGDENFPIALIQSFNKNMRGGNEFTSGLKVQLHVYLSPS